MSTEQFDELYSVLKDQLNYQEQHNVKERCSRIMLFFSLPEDVSTNLPELLKGLKAFFKKYESVTGMILIYPLSVAIIAEAGEDIVLSFLKGLDDLTDTADGYFDCGRVIATCENCPERIFGEQIVQTVTRAREQEVDLEADGYATNGQLLFNNLVTIGTKLFNSALSREDYKAAIDTMSKGFAQYLPSNERILKYTESDLFFTLTDFVEQFCSPVDTYAKNDQEWPQQYSIPAWIVLTQSLYPNTEETTNPT